MQNAVLRLVPESQTPLLSCVRKSMCVSVVQALPVSWQAGVRTCQQFHSSTGSREEAGDQADSQAEASSSSRDSTPAATPATGPVHARHISLNDPELNIRLSYNKNFVMDPDRKYAIGHVNDLQRKTRLELQKALAAQRLSLRDAAAAAAPGSKQLPLREQMLTRLAELQQACRS